MGYSLHQTTIPRKYIGIMVYYCMRLTVELGGKRFLRDGHAYPIGQSLTKRASSSFDTRRITVFRVTWRFRMKLSKIFQFFHRNVISCQMEKRIDQH